jgi:hypothetical protein
VEITPACHRTSVTLDPLALLFPMFEVAVERSLPKDFSIAGIAGIGLESPKEWEVGAQARYYALGDFNHGMPIVCEALFTRDNRDYENERELRVSLLVGYMVYIQALSEDIAADAGIEKLMDSVIGSFRPL